MTKPHAVHNYLTPPMKDRVRVVIHEHMEKVEGTDLWRFKKPGWSVIRLAEVVNAEFMKEYGKPCTPGNVSGVMRAYSMKMYVTPQEPRARAARSAVPSNAIRLTEDQHAADIWSALTRQNQKYKACQGEIERLNKEVAALKERLDRLDKIASVVAWPGPGPAPWKEPLKLVSE